MKWMIIMQQINDTVYRIFTNSFHNNNYARVEVDHNISQCYLRPRNKKLTRQMLD